MKRWAGVVILLSVVSAAHGADQCRTCHPESRVAFEASIHNREGVDCTSCHRGNGDVLDVDRAHAGSFRSLKGRQVVPAMCAECHSDLDRMRPYNLPVDQYAIYQTSRHGKALAGGDIRAAICTDCHGTHETRRVADPKSKANQRNIVDTCSECHGDEALMRDYGLDAGIPAAYRESVHGKAILSGNLGAPTCTSCHGFHGAVPPGFGDVDKVCGGCHLNAREAFLAGPHYRGMLGAGLPECASCHSNHAIRTLEDADVSEVCSECHGSDSSQAEKGKRIELLYESAADEVRKARELTETAERLPVDVEHYFGRLEEAQTLLTAAVPLVHTVSVEDVDVATRRARSIGEEVQRELYSDLDRRDHYIALAVFWFYLLMTLWILRAYKRRLRREGRE